MMKHALAVLCVMALVIGCGGKKPQTTPVDDSGGTGSGFNPQPDQNTNHAMVSNETMDEITRMFERKGKAVSRCLSIIIDNKELPKNSRGKITVEVTIQPSGKVGAVNILKASIDSKPLHNCVLDRVREIEFPKLPKPWPTTYTYAFEAN